MKSRVVNSGRTVQFPFVVTHEGIRVGDFGDGRLHARVQLRIDRIGGPLKRDVAAEYMRHRAVGIEVHDTDLVAIGEAPVPVDSESRGIAQPQVVFQIDFRPRNAAAAINANIGAGVDDEGSEPQRQRVRQRTTCLRKRNGRHRSEQQSEYRDLCERSFHCHIGAPSAALNHETLVPLSGRTRQVRACRPQPSGPAPVVIATMANIPTASNSTATINVSDAGYWLSA